jgi:SAM-dependent methyltransferase
MPKLRAMLPVRVRHAGRYGLGALQDVMDTARRDRDATLPPHRLRSVGGGDFAKIGEGIADQLVDLAGLAPSHDVLDVGCGVGRVAIPLASYLSTGSYAGFDIVRSAIEWCQRNISKSHPNFRFDLVSLRNTEYRPSAASDAATFRFPYPDNSFDLAFATSVFTHLLPGSMANYVAEIARVLRPGGTSFTTWFVLNADVRARVAAETGPQSFPWDYGDYAVDDRRVPEASIAFDEGFIHRTFASAGLAVREPIIIGDWSGRTASQPGQDIVIADKPAVSP